MADFPKSADKAHSIIRGINADFRELDHSKPPTSSKLESRIRSKLHDLAVEIDELVRNTSKFKGSNVEKDRRNKTISELEDQHSQLERKLRTLTRNDSIDLPIKPLKQQSDEDLWQQQKQMKERNIYIVQDKTIEELAGTTANLVEYGENIGEELDVHMHLLGVMEKGIDANSSRLATTQAKLLGYVQKSSDTCLMCTIYILAAILIIIILFL